jgi:predicted transcriptional regulator
MRRRTDLEIVAEILGLCLKPQCKTRVMQRSNLSWKLADEYLSYLQERGLLDVHHSAIRYVTSQKGLAFLEKWARLEELLPPTRI